MSAGPENILKFPARHHQSDADDAPLVAPGPYIATYERHYAAVVFKNRASKVCIQMRLLEHPEIVLERWYRVREFRGGRIVASRSSDIVREFRDVLGRCVRRDRLAPAMLKGLYVRVTVRTVVSNYEQQETTENNHYSVIGRLIARVDP